MRILVPEVLELANSAKSDEERMSILKKNFTPVLEQLIQYALAEHLEFDLPEGEPPFKCDRNIPIGHSPSSLFSESRRLYIFLRGFAENMPKMRKESLFIQMLEGLHCTEADLMIVIKDKRFTEVYPNLTYELMYKTFDNLLPPPETRKNVQPVVEKVEVNSESFLTKPVLDEPDELMRKVERDQAHRQKLEQQKIENRKRPSNSRFITGPNGERIRIKANGEPWPKPGQKKALNEKKNDKIENPL